MTYFGLLATIGDRVPKVIDNFKKRYKSFGIPQIPDWKPCVEHESKIAEIPYRQALRLLYRQALKCGLCKVALECKKGSLEKPCLIKDLQTGDFIWMCRYCVG